MFTENFKNSDTCKVRDGARISCAVGGITYTATIHRDDSNRNPAKDDDGFWPSLDPEASGWIGDNPARSYEAQMAACEAVMAKYRAGGMIYCGVVITAAKGGVDLLTGFKQSLWGIDINWPHNDNGYLLEVANELLTQGAQAAESALVSELAKMRAVLALLEA